MKGYTREERWVPVDEFGERWTPRSRESAEAAMRDYPEGALYADGAPMGGVVRIIREVRYVTEWAQEPATDPRHQPVTTAVLGRLRLHRSTNATHTRRTPATSTAALGRPLQLRAGIPPHPS